MVLYGWKLQPMIYFRDFIIMVLPLECYLTIKTLLFITCFLDLVDWHIDWHLTNIVAFNLETWLYVQCHCIKVTTLYIFKALICVVHAPLAYNDFSFLWFRHLRMTNWSIIIFEAWSYFQLLGARDRYKALTILHLSPQKVPSLINFLDYLAFCTL